MSSFMGFRSARGNGWRAKCAFLLPSIVAGLLIVAVRYVLASPATNWGGTLTEDTTLHPEDNPHIVDSTLVVAAGVTLTIEPGVELYFAPRASLVVYGRLLAEGEPAQRILFTRRDEGTYWGTIAIIESYADNRITHAVIEYTREGLPNPRSDGVTAVDSRLTLADSVLRFTESSSGVNSYWHSILQVSRNEIHDIQGDAVRVNGGQVVIEGNHIYNARYGIYAHEGIAILNMQPNSPALVVDNQVHDVSDDCLDVNDSWVAIERNRVYNCPDKGISIGTGHQVPPGTKATSATVVNNLVYSSSIGIAVKDSAVARLVHNTVVDNEVDGLALYEAVSGYGGGAATVANTILWGNGQSIRLDAVSTVAVTHSDVAGGWSGEGNLDADPSFWAAGDYHLNGDSPAIDAGRKTGIATDLDSLFRYVGAAPDMGAYEWPPLRLTGRPGDRVAYLRWWRANVDLPVASYAISTTVSARGTLALTPTLISGLPTTTLAYTLTDLVNYAWYTVVVEARDVGDDLLVRSNAVTVMPTDIAVFLPLTVRPR
jgi:hypothetical protein